MTGPQVIPQPSGVQYAPPSMHPLIAMGLVRAMGNVRSVAKKGRNREEDYAYAEAEDLIESGKAALAAESLTLYSEVEVLDRSIVRRSWLMHACGVMQPVGALPWPIVAGNGKPADKLLAAALTTSLGYVYRGVLAIACTEHMDASARRPSPPRETHEVQDDPAAVELALADSDEPNGPTWVGEVPRGLRMPKPWERKKRGPSVLKDRNERVASLREGARLEAMASVASAVAAVAAKKSPGPEDTPPLVPVEGLSPSTASTESDDVAARRPGNVETLTAAPSVGAVASTHEVQQGERAEKAPPAASEDVGPGVSPAAPLASPSRAEGPGRTEPTQEGRTEPTAPPLTLARVIEMGDSPEFADLPPGPVTLGGVTVPDEAEARAAVLAREPVVVGGRDPRRDPQPGDVAAASIDCLPEKRLLVLSVVKRPDTGHDVVALDGLGSDRVLGLGAWRSRFCDGVVLRLGAGTLLDGEQARAAFKIEERPTAADEQTVAFDPVGPCHALGGRDHRCDSRPLPTWISFNGGPLRPQRMCNQACRELHALCKAEGETVHMEFVDPDAPEVEDESESLSGGDLEDQLDAALEQGMAEDAAAIRKQVDETRSKVEAGELPQVDRAGPVVEVRPANPLRNLADAAARVGALPADETITEQTTPAKKHTWAPSIGRHTTCGRCGLLKGYPPDVDITTARLSWSDDGGKTWTKGTKLPKCEKRAAKGAVA